MGLTEVQMTERDESLKQLKITTYKDKMGYVFVSYKSDDWKTVFEGKVFQLQKMGLRVYCDKNFNDTNHPWLDDMEKNIKYSSAVVLFISNEYLKSYATLIELLTAIKYKKEIVPVYFERRDSLFGKLEDDVDLEDDIIKMEPIEAEKLKALMQTNDGQYAESIKKIWHDCSNKFSSQKFSVMNVVDAFKSILCGNGLKDNLLRSNNESLKNTIIDACSTAKHKEVFGVTAGDEDATVHDEHQVVSKPEIEVKTATKTVVSVNAETDVEGAAIMNTQSSGSIYHIKGRKYEAYLSYEDNKYILLKGSKVAENWREYAGVKVIALHEAKVGEGCIMLEDAEFNTISAIAKFVKGTSTDGGDVFVEKNLVKEVRPISDISNEATFISQITASNIEKDVSDTKDKTRTSNSQVKLSFNTTLKEFRTYMLDEQFAKEIGKMYQDSNSLGISKSAFAVAMLPLLAGDCRYNDITAYQENFIKNCWNYIKGSPKDTAAWSWSSMTCKYMTGIKYKSSPWLYKELPDYVSAYKNLSEDTTFQMIYDNFKNQIIPGFSTAKGNEAVMNSIEILIRNFQ